MSYQPFGRIIHADPHANCYSVAIFGDDRNIAEKVPYISSGTPSKFGPTGIGALSPGDIVFLHMGEGKSETFITGPAPYGMVLHKKSQASSVIPSDVTIGAWRDSLLKTVSDPKLTVGDCSLYSGFSSGVTNEFGVGYGSTMLRAFIRASDVCGVDAFFQDSLLRVKGYNYQLWTSMGESGVETLGGTASDCTVRTWHVHESFGKNTKTEEFKVDSMYQELMGSKDKKSGKAAYDDLKAAAEKPDALPEVKYRLAAVHQKYEQLQKDHPQILPRNIQLAGYIGHGLSNLIVRPGSQVIADGRTATDATGLPKDWSKKYLDGIYNKKEVPVTSGLSEIHQAADGRVRITSAKGISLVKELHIPVPYRKDQDKEASGSQLDVKSEPDMVIESPMDSSRLYARRELDYRYKDRKFLKSHPAWEFDTDCDSVLEKYFKEKHDGIDNIQGGLTEFQHKVPKNIEMEVDSGTKARYYQGRAGIFVTDDGSIVIADAYGASIVLSGGNIYANCPGDIMQLPGRDLTFLAGRGVNIRSQKDAEIVSSKGNLRIKAEKQLSAIGGSGGEDGGVLIQSKGVSQEPSGLGEEFTTGGVVVKSETQISVRSPYVGVLSGTTTFTGYNKEKTEVAVNGLVAAETVTAYDMDAGIIYGESLHTEWLNAEDGKFGGLSTYAQHSEYSDSADASNTAVMAGDLGDAGSPGGPPKPQSISANPTQVSPPFNGTEPDMMYYTGIVETAGGFMSPETGFSFNSSTEYGVTKTEDSGESEEEAGIASDYGFKIYESLWQSRIRFNTVAAGVKYWEEKEVRGDKYGLPYPGRKVWEDESLAQPRYSDKFMLDPDFGYVTSIKKASLSDKFIITNAE